MLMVSKSTYSGARLSRTPSPLQAGYICTSGYGIPIKPPEEAFSLPPEGAGFSFCFLRISLELGDPIPVGSTDGIGSLVECTMQRFRRSGTSILGSLSAPNLKRKAQNSWAAMQDTFFSTKDTFERHRVVFTVGTSIASVATAWIGYSLRHLHESKVDQRLESIERAMKNNYDLEHTEIRKIVGSGGCSIPACVATAGTTLIIGYGLGWRTGSWYANKRFRREQMKMLGQIKPRRWQLLPGQIKARARGWQFQFLRRPLTRSKVPETSVAETSETTTVKDSC